MCMLSLNYNYCVNTNFIIIEVRDMVTLRCQAKEHGSRVSDDLINEALRKLK